MNLPEAVRRDLCARFQLVSQLGEGGMGLVLHVRDATGRDLALKLVRESTPQRIERFRREGELTARLDHPGILRVHAAGEAGGEPWLAYELVPSCLTLDQAAAAQDRRSRVTSLRDVARAIGHAHEAGIVHRDLKPANILVDPAGRVRVADFGIAAAVDLERLTRTGAIVGSPAYMAPEQFSGGRGPSVDVWSLGVILYELLTGSLPFVGESLAELAERIQEGAEPPRSREPEIPADLEAVCMKALAVDPGSRYPDGGALADDLEAWLDGLPVMATRWWRLQRRWRRYRLHLAGGLAAAAVVLAAALMLRRPASAPTSAPPSPAPGVASVMSEQSDSAPAPSSWRLAWRLRVGDVLRWTLTRDVAIDSSLAQTGQSLTVNGALHMGLRLEVEEAGRESVTLRVALREFKSSGKVPQEVDFDSTRLTAEAARYRALAENHWYRIRIDPETGRLLELIGFETMAADYRRAIEEAGWSPKWLPIEFQHANEARATFSIFLHLLPPRDQRLIDSWEVRIPLKWEKTTLVRTIRASEGSDHVQLSWSGRGRDLTTRGTARYERGLIRRAERSFTRRRTSRTRAGSLVRMRMVRTDRLTLTKE